MTTSAYERAGSSAAGDTLEDVDTFAIETESMSVWYGHVRAVRNLSIHVPRGSTYGLIGRRGAGKSATLRTLATLQRPSAGTVLVDGIDVRANPGAARGRIGYMPDVSGVYEGLTVDEYLDLCAGIYRIPARRRRPLIDDLLELVGLMDRRKSPMKRLSRSMRRQLDLARCLIHDPQILLLDEPASGMDPHARLELRDILAELTRLDKTILISSNILSEVDAICSHLGILRDGELMVEGPADEIVNGSTGDARLRVRVRGAGERDVARRLLEANSACRQIEAEGESTLHARFAGTEDDLADIARGLCTVGVQVIEFAVERQTLEDVFLQLTETTIRS